MQLILLHWKLLIYSIFQSKYWLLRSTYLKHLYETDDLIFLLINLLVELIFIINTFTYIKMLMKSFTIECFNKHKFNLIGNSMLTSTWSATSNTRVFDGWFWSLIYIFPQAKCLHSMHSLNLTSFNCSFAYLVWNDQCWLVNYYMKDERVSKWSVSAILP